MINCVYCGKQLTKEDEEHGEDTCSIYCFNLTYVCDIPGSDAMPIYADLLNDTIQRDENDSTTLII